MATISPTLETKDVEIRSAVKKYGSNLILNGIDLDVRQGELLTLLGPSGCGKTTTLNIIAGFIDLDEGDVYIKGKRMNGIPTYKRNLGMVFQSFSLFPHMTIEQNLEFGLSFHKLDKKEKQRRIKDNLEVVKMSGLEKRYPRELSGGQRQRVAIARALVVQPKLLLLDEPLSSLDAKLRHELRIEIKRLQKELGVTTVFVTHDQEEALSMSDRIVVMNKGIIEQIGTPTDIYKNPKTEFVFQFIGRSNCLQGTVESVDDQTVFVRLQDDWKMSVNKTNILGSEPHCEVGRTVNLYFRPETVAVYSTSENRHLENEHRVKVTQLNYLGSSWEMEVSLFGEFIQIITPTIDSNWSVGSEVVLGWNSSEVMLVKK